ncbi:6-pyruvoyl trahydropterin synthase family protein [Sphingomonas sp.]|uniref:6-pyruvoyl trahydropterin synthase family protein n=1 Tax=Sphingomonas sp. TaxID=28214 RepID=UPI003B3B6EE7
MTGRTLTGVGWHFSAAHRSVDDVLHGHTWEVVVWVAGGGDAVALQDRLRAVLAPLDHGELPRELIWGEAIAAWIAERMAETGLDVAQVDVSRAAERIFARWIAG